MLLTLEHRVRAAPSRMTSRVMEVASMFGLGAEIAREHTIVPHTEIELPLPGPGVVFITGPSGSGKSTLLRLIADSCAQRGVRVLRMPDAVSDDDVEAASADACVIDRIAADRPLSEALELLSLAGLGDAFVMLRRPGELSDGQRFRLRLAHLLAAARGSGSSPTAIVIDEFAATLDRITAQSLARNIHRWSRRTGVTFVLATTHDDLIESLQPDVLIHKPLNAAIEVVARPAEALNADDQFRIEPGTLEDYRALAAFHYRSHHPGGATSVLRIVTHAPTTVGRFLQRRDEPTLVGVLVRSLPALACRLRDIAMRDRYAHLTPHERGIALNREVRCISRVVIEPRFRGLGLAVRLVRHALEHPESDSLICTEALAAMGRASPFFERAGMQRFDLPVACRAAHARLLDALQSVHCSPHDLLALASTDKGAACDALPPLTSAHRSLLRREVRLFLRSAGRFARAQLDAMTDAHLFAAAQQRLMLQPVYFFFSHSSAQRDSIAGDAMPGL